MEAERRASDDGDATRWEGRSDRALRRALQREHHAGGNRALPEPGLRQSAIDRAHQPVVEPAAQLWSQSALAREAHPVYAAAAQHHPVAAGNSLRADARAGAAKNRGDEMPDP